MTTHRTPRRGGQRRIAKLAAAGLVALAVSSGAVLGSTAVDAGAAASTAVRPASPTQGLTGPQSIAGFLQSINDLRASLGLGGMARSAELDAVAQRWTERMAAAHDISHNPNLASEVSGGWSMLGENVGIGWDVLSLMRAFIGSPHHYENLVNPAFNYVGVGAVMTPDGELYTTHVFMQLDPGGAPVAPPPPAPKPRPAPPAPAPTTTVPPAPTTTVPIVEAPAPPPPAPSPSPTPERVATLLGALRSLDPAA